MFIPLGTDRPARRRPRVTEALIIINLIIYLCMLVGEYGRVFDQREVINIGHLWARQFHIWQLITYQFLHSPNDIFHIAFNMLFLWIFGGAVEDRLGRGGFLAFYLMGGMMAGWAHVSLEPDAPVIGASGSIAGLTGAFLALFPRSRIKVLIIFFFLGVIQIPSMWFIGFVFMLDILNQVSSILGGSESNIAYAAHIAGYIFGFSLSLVLLATGIVKREEFDLFYLMKQAKRRAEFRAASRQQVGGLYESASANTSKTLAKSELAPNKQTEVQKQTMEARANISRLVQNHQLSEAAEAYSALLNETPEAVLSEPVQLDVANQLYTQQNYSHAALAYELLLHHYPRCSRSIEVQLLLGIILLRQLKQPDRAQPFIKAALSGHLDPEQKQLAEDLMRELET